MKAHLQVIELLVMELRVNDTPLLHCSDCFFYVNTQVGYLPILLHVGFGELNLAVTLEGWRAIVNTFPYQQRRDGVETLVGHHFETHVR